MPETHAPIELTVTSQATILIADDDAVTRKLIGAQVGALGHQALFASNGLRAWNLLEDNPGVDLLITDIQMPEMDGENLILTIRGDSAFCQLPVILISGVVGPKKISQLLDIGVSRFLAKPVDLMTLAGYIGDLLSETMQAVA